MRAIFLDRDGTINAGVPKFERVDSVDKVEILPNVIEGLRVLAGLDYKLFLVTNQAGLAEGLITPADFDDINARVLGDIAGSGAEIVETYVCPHADDDACECRKPQPKMLLDAAEKYGIDLSRSWMVGDRETDVLTGKNAGTKTILVTSGAIGSSETADYVAPDLLAAAEHIRNAEVS